MNLEEGDAEELTYQLEHIWQNLGIEDWYRIVVDLVISSDLNSLSCTARPISRLRRHFDKNYSRTV